MIVSMLRKAVIAAAATIALGTLVFPWPTRAQGFSCVGGCATVVNQLIEQANQVRQIEQQILSVEYEIHQWEELVKMTATLPQRIFQDVQDQINTIEGIGQNASLVGQQIAFLQRDISSPGGYSGDLSDIPRQLARIDAALAYAMQAFGNAVSATQEATGSHISTLADLARTPITGATQGAEVQLQMLGQIGQNLTAQSSASLTSQEAMAAAHLRVANREAIQDKALKDWSGDGALPLTGYKGF